MLYLKERGRETLGKERRAALELPASLGVLGKNLGLG